MDINKIEQAIVTLYEGHYHFGVASLLNSLLSSNFEGLFRVGYRGEIPHWAQKLRCVSEHKYVASDNILIDFVLIESDMHFGYYKPSFLLDTLNKYDSVKNVYYFDPDIVVNAPWSFFSNWVKSGIALCLDNCFHYVHRNHPWRKEWMQLAGVGNDFKCEVDYYINSGFIGLNKSDVGVLEKWILLTKRYREIGGDVSMFEKEGHRAFKGDQDLLNAVITVGKEFVFSIIGKEGMGFTQPAYLMSHAVASIKPWKKNHFLHLIQRGKRPDFADIFYMKYANHPVKPFSDNEFWKKKMNLRISLAIGRLIG